MAAAFIDMGRRQRGGGRTPIMAIHFRRIPQQVVTYAEIRCGDDVEDADIQAHSPVRHVAQPDIARRLQGLAGVVPDSIGGTHDRNAP